MESLLKRHLKSRIYHFFVSKHCDIFLWAEISWRQIESFSDKKCELQMRSCLTMFLSSPLVLSRLTSRFLFGRDSRYVLIFQIEASTTSILEPNITTR